MSTNNAEIINVKVVAYGIAREIMGGFEHDLQLDAPASLADVRALMIKKYPDFQKLASLRFAVGENYQPDDFTLQANDEVVIIPPVSGG